MDPATILARLSQMSGGGTQWDPTLPHMANCVRMVQGNDAIPEPELRRMREETAARAHRRAQMMAGPSPLSASPNEATATTQVSETQQQSDTANQTDEKAASDADEITERMQSLFPGSTWDPTLDPRANIARMVMGSTNLDDDLKRVNEANARQRRAMGITQAEERAEGSISYGDRVIARAKKEFEFTGTEFQEIIQALNPKRGQVCNTPLLALQHLVASVFLHGPLRAGGLYGSLGLAAEHNTNEAEVPSENLDVEWRSCKAAATLVGLLACPVKQLYSTRKFLSGLLGGLPTLKEIRTTPSASLPVAFRAAKTLARKAPVMTLILVSLVDVHIFELAAKRKADNFTSFAHSFAIGIGPEGVIVWQAWGEHGYSLDKFIENGGARLRDWQEAGSFIDWFDRLTQYKGKWDAKRNKLYQQCFEVDINSICGPEGPSKPIVPEYEAWVRLKVVEGVQFADLYKYSFHFL
ncbi:hypothetical protein LTR97_001466 [Elasticomyces elasticus]|uniref:Uncharacterized protein n=1 Tax=Elasticomyces elasticus TaxID=574655 RepID=A0AAN7WQH7_9PEZI|nr:hypothetical protein LTR97_001466 [Elasticomyces elasticus]